MESVLHLAKELGLVETFSADIVESVPVDRGSQPFDYVVVIDFESTCWDSKYQNPNWHHLPEIIEFPAVLLNLSTGIIESEFHHYVMPVENPKLSDFCTKLTGIKQEQVESGVPLATCLMLFNHWIAQICDMKNIFFHKKLLEHKSCTFVTWSDWDLAVCLHNEVKRKQLRRPDVLNQWIDLRALYKEFYKRRPLGLRGALAELGIHFSGREHSGIVDARNTAHLAFRMISDGCTLDITGCLKIPTPQKGRGSCILRHQKLEENLPNIQKVTLGRQPLATITVQTLLKTPTKFQKIYANSMNCSLNGSSEIPTGTIGNADIVNGVTSINAGLQTPNRRMHPPSSCKRTPPLCRCGRRAVLKVTNTPGPNQGRKFFTCSNFRKSLGVPVKKGGCGYFMWC